MTTTVLTLVANPATDIPFLTIVEKAQASLQAHGAETGAPVWLREGVAADLIFDGTVQPENLSDILNDVDYCLQPTLHRRKKLLLADMDSTIITVECIDELADYAGVKDKVSAITEQAMRGELDFNEAFRARVAMLKGLEESVLQRTFDERVTLTPGARTLIQTLRQNGAYTALVSGGFTFFTSRVRDSVGFHMHESNELLFENGRLTGEAAEPILNSAAKLDNLNRLIAELGIDRQQSVAIGDGANDIPMIEAAGLGVAFHAKPKANEAADATIRFGDLTTLLYYQGYTYTEFFSD
ncbi:phosphoserine phosphatase SerB [Sneathiella chinensis]|uniref:phosphoserine phosphatase SerB n=1 Tax=Sneathiella chinensis TaxID=349750 RepID=UPI00146C1D62|nr:phosphoserine phosphatase SerB [Sneathiella chinensis]